MKIRYAVLPLALLAVGCSSPQQKDVESSPLGTYAVEEISPLADKMLKEIKLGDSVRGDVLVRLKEMLADPEFAPKLTDPGVNAVGVFQFGSGGLVLSGGAGSGLISFADGSQSVPFDTQAFAMGFTAGGQNTFGVLVVTGLDHEEKFTDGYNFTGHGGTVGETSYRMGNAKPDRGTHEVQFCGSGIGVGGSAAAATGEMVLKPDAELVEPEDGDDHDADGHDHKDGEADHEHKDGDEHGK